MENDDVRIFRYLTCHGVWGRHGEPRGCERNRNDNGGAGLISEDNHLLTTQGRT